MTLYNILTEKIADVSARMAALEATWGGTPVLRRSEAQRQAAMEHGRLEQIRYRLGALLDADMPVILRAAESFAFDVIAALTDDPAAGDVLARLLDVRSALDDATGLPACEYSAVHARAYLVAQAWLAARGEERVGSRALEILSAARQGQHWIDWSEDLAVLAQTPAHRVE